LSILKLNNNRIGIQGIQFLMKIFKTNKLIEINLSKNRIGDDGIRNISPALKDMKVNSYVFLKSTIYFKL